MKTHYPNFDVMVQKDRWDQHTRDIVARRLEESEVQTLSKDEVTTLIHLCSTLTGDNRKPILDSIVSHFDNKLTSSLGEGQRKKGLLKFAQLLPFGLKALDGQAKSFYGMSFEQLTRQQQSDLLQQLIRKNRNLEVDGVQMKAKDFLSVLHTETVSAYYSHPTVWSEIGYAGPAYPRGYVRTERGLTDPWEAKQPHA